MKHIRLYLFVLFAACSMFMVCPFAYADSMASNIYDIALSEFSTWSGYNNGLTYFSQAASECQYVFIGVSGSYKVIYFSSVSDPVIFWDNSSRLIMPFNTINDIGTGGSIGSISQYTSSTPFILYGFCDNGSGTFSCSYKAVLTNYNSQSNSRQSYNYYGYQTFSFSSLYGSLQYNYSSNRNNIVRSNSYGNFHFFTNIWIHSTSNLEPVLYTEDERLKLYKLWSSQNGDSLVVDLSAFRSYTPAAAYEFSNIVLTLTTNGVDTDYNLPLSSSTINNGWVNNSNLYTISTPVSDFTLSDTYDTFISKVSFSLDVSSPGGSGSTPYYISTNFPLDFHHSSITPDAVPTPFYDNPTIKFDSEISTIIGELNNKSSSTNNGQFEYSYIYNVPSWCDKYQETLFRFSDNSSSSVAGQFVDKIPYENGSITNYQVIDIYDYISSIIDTYDNSYDVFVFPVDVWFVSDVVTTPNYTDNGISYYIIFYTTRYFQRQSSLTDIDILYVLQKDANNFVDFVEYMQVRLDDFESKSLEIFNPIYDETTYIDDKLASILYAVNSIENYNDSSIVSLLTDIKNLLSSPENEIDTPQECIQLYEAHPNYFDELWGTPTPALRSASVTPSANNPYISSDYVRADLVPAWWEGKTLTMIYILKNDGETSRFYNDILNGLFDSYENLIESDNSFNTYIDSLFKTGYDYTDSFYGHMFDLNYNPEAWDGGFAENE